MIKLGIRMILLGIMIVFGVIGYALCLNGSIEFIIAYIGILLIFWGGVILVSKLWKY